MSFSTIVPSFLHRCRAPLTATGFPFALFAVLAAALAVRLWGVTWGLPLKKAHIDESVVIFYTMRFLTGDLNPHIFFDYPSLFLYLLGIIFTLTFLAGKLFGVFPSLDHFVGLYLNGDASLIYTAARVVSAVFGVGSVWLVYRIGKEHFSSGIMPALLLSFIPLHVLHSHYATVDVAAVFFLLAAFLYFARYHRGERGNRDLYHASFLLGLATATKYYPALLFLPMLVAAAAKERGAAARMLPVAGLLLAAGFVAGCPFALLDFPAFSARFIDRFQLIVWPDASGVSAPFASFKPLPLLVNLARGLTPPVFLWAGAGILFSLVAPGERRKTALLGLAFPAVFLLFLATWKTVSAHYLLPVFPFLLLAAGQGWSRLPLRTGGRFAVLIIYCAVLLPAALRSVSLDRALVREDTRLAAYRWIKGNVPPGSRILRLPFTPEFSPGDPFFVRVDWEGKGESRSSPARLAAGYDYIIVGSFGGACPPWESALASHYRPIREWAHVPLATFHHPRITLYAKKT